MSLRLIEPDEGNLIDLPGVGPCPRPVDIDQSMTGFAKLKSLRVYRFAAGRTIEGESEGDEVYLTALSGAADLAIGGRQPLAADLKPGRIVYMTPNHDYRLTPRSETLVAYARAAAEGRIASYARDTAAGQGERLRVSRMALDRGERRGVEGEALVLVVQGRLETEAGTAQALRTLAVPARTQIVVTAAEAALIWIFSAR